MLWMIFNTDVRFVQLHKLTEEMLCIPATSAAVEHIFEHKDCLHSYVELALALKLLPTMNETYTSLEALTFTDFFLLVISYVYYLWQKYTNCVMNRYCLPAH